MVQAAGTRAPHLEDDEPLGRRSYATGSPRERGRAHGEHLRERIAFGLDESASKRSPRTASRATTLRRSWAEWLAGTTYLDAALLPHAGARQELRGIAEGAAQLVEEDPRLQLDGRDVGLPSRIASVRGAPVRMNPLRPAAVRSRWAIRRERRSAPGPDHGPRGHTPQGTQAVLRTARDDGHEVLVVTRAGMIGLMGANDAGLGVLRERATLLRPATRAACPWRS